MQTLKDTMKCEISTDQLVDISPNLLPNGILPIKLIV